MKYFYYLTLLLFAIALSGCSWRMPERPISMQMQVPDKFGEATQKEEKSESIKVGARWWEVLADPVLDGLQDQMARENPNLIALAASVSQAKAAVALAQSNMWPTLNANTSVTRSQSYLTAPSGTYISESFPFTWTPDIWGAMDAQIISLRAQQKTSEENLTMARLTAQATLMQTYLTLRNVERSQATLLATEKSYAKALEITQSRYASGVVSSSDVAQAKLQLSNAQAQRIDLGVQRAQLQHAIAALLGKSPSSFRLEPTGKISSPINCPTLSPATL